MEMDYMLWKFSEKKGAWSFTSSQENKAFVDNDKVLVLAVEVFTIVYPRLDNRGWFYSKDDINAKWKNFAEMKFTYLIYFRW